ncbi:FAD-binding oxidoreductase, partial [Actinoplanes sp. TFC3]|uniref:FAD-binding oxidoreductase n=1 Tax=Actinoplanes sp. TFC3 TaxID=1710355 RepID=UPI001F2FAB99
MDPKQPRLPAREPVLRALIDICGPDFARPATIADSVAGRLASFVATPATPRAVAATMRLAAERGLAVVARGSGSKLDWGKPPPGVDLILDTGRLNGIWHHNREQATAEIATGTAIRAIQAALALRGQRLAVDPPTPSATLGGVLARNEAGPLRHRFGTPAAQVHKVTYTTRDGHEAESDGENGSPGIAEIDGVLLSATVHVEPLPEARRWVRTPVQ